MSRETIDQKARRYLSEGRVLIQHVNPYTVHAKVRGSDSYYRITGDDTGWLCTCPSQRTCCHLTAVWLVTLRPQPQRKQR